MKQQFKLECANCQEQQDLPESPSMDRVIMEANDFFEKHKSRFNCEKKSIFLTSFED